MRVTMSRGPPTRKGYRMHGNLGSLRPGRWRVGILAATGAIAAAMGLAVVVPGPVLASATRTAIATASSKVTCVKRAAVTPPPLGVLKRAAAPGHATQPVPAAPTVKAVCLAGQVPVVKGLAQQVAHAALAGNRVLSGSAAAQAAAAVKCAGTAEQNSCYYWASATDLRTDHGGGFTMKIEKPSVAKTATLAAGHSLEEMSVQAGSNFGNIIEIGSIVNSDKADPELFVFHWINGKPTCYDLCGYHQYSNTYYPDMDLSALVGKSVYSGYVYYKGRWWAWFNGQWLGWFPGSLWKGKFGVSQEIQWFGEVSATRFPPRTQMGNGRFAGNAAAAPLSTMCDVNVAAWRCYYYNQQRLFASDSKFYTIKATGFGAVRVGGPGT
jgi:hypothetical protein